MKRTMPLLLAVIMLLSLAACVQAPVAVNADETPDWQTQYDLGVRYLSEGNYEAAILAFNAAIEIDPKNPDAYIKLAEVYEQTGDDEAALRTLQTGAQNTGSDELTARAEEMQKALEAPAEPDEPETPAEPEASEPPDWPARLAGIGYLGDVANCRMSAEAAEAYAAVLEQLPETKDDWRGFSNTYRLKAALYDPGDGYPLLLTCYPEDGPDPNLTFQDENGAGPLQIWWFNGKTAEAYSFLDDAGSGSILGCEFCTYDGRQGLYIVGFAGAGESDGEGLWSMLIYTISEYRLILQRNFIYENARVCVDTDSERRQEDGQNKTLQEYLDEGWAIGAEPENGYVEVIRCLADGARSRSDGADGSSLNHDFLQAERRIQTDDSLDWRTAMDAGPDF